jgi:flavin-dependent dehydrogenase
MNEKKRIIIIGGGLAGLTAAIHLRKLLFSVTLIEKNQYPKHKVCGEYISNEVLPYLEWLNISIEDLTPSKIKNLTLSSETGKTISTKLPLGGFGISRYTLDNYLFEKAQNDGCKMVQETVENIYFDNEIFTVETANTIKYQADLVLGAFGKRSNLDIQIKRDFIQKKSSWLAVKAHFEGNFTEDLVGLYNFKGGYCGISKVENNQINICYLVSYDEFKKYKNSDEFQKKVLEQNPILKAIFQNIKPLFEKPLTIGQISFEKKQTVENHILMIGDTAGLIHPLCGNGMAMAIHSAKIASEVIHDFFSNENINRIEMEKKYSQKWNSLFKNRLRFGRFLATILLKPKSFNFLFKILTKTPFLLPIIIAKTHGKTIEIDN